LRHRLGDVSAERIGRFRQEALLGTRQPRQLLRERMELRCLRMMLREIAEENSLALAGGKARRDRLRAALSR
jgi:hypothetical protein